MPSKTRSSWSWFLIERSIFLAILNISICSWFKTHQLLFETLFGYTIGNTWKMYIHFAEQPVEWWHGKKERLFCFQWKMTKLSKEDYGLSSSEYRVFSLCHYIEGNYACTISHETHIYVDIKKRFWEKDYICSLINLTSNYYLTPIMEETFVKITCVLKLNCR